MKRPKLDIQALALAEWALASHCNRLFKHVKKQDGTLDRTFCRMLREDCQALHKLRPVIEATDRGHQFIALIPHNDPQEKYPLTFCTPRRSAALPSGDQAAKAR
jgi:hypothetical protein